MYYNTYYNTYYNSSKFSVNVQIFLRASVSRREAIPSPQNLTHVGSLCVSTEQDTAVYLKTDDRYNIFILLTRSPDEMLCPDGL